ncbi:MAG: hypothetical protein ACRDFQ_09080 [Anaerolineales bacterium]
MKTKFAKQFGLALLACAILLIAISQPVSADPGDHWHGSPDPDLCNEFNDCIYIFNICYQGSNQTLGSHQESPLQHAVLVEMIGATFGSCTLIQSQRCKLVEVATTIKLGVSHPFSARWRGSISSLRFRDEDGVVFIAPVPGSIHFENGARAGLFSTADASGVTLLSPGTYKVSCFGSSRTAGEEIKVTVTR